jgi:FHA domain
MSNKTIWTIVSQLLRGGRSTLTGSGRSETVCPNGHPMDPSWTSCPRCDAESRAQERSSTGASSVTSNETSSGSSFMSSRQSTIASGSMPSSEAPGTRIDREDSTTPPARHVPSRRKITGVLVTFTWERQGDLFVLYEGRNVIGKGNVESEGGRPCDVLLTGDETMSSEHAVILCRAGRYELFDNRSTNGTYSDGVFVESAGISLQDGAKIKTGETVWLFRKIESDATGTSPGHTRHEEPREQHPSRDQSRIS